MYKVGDYLLYVASQRRELSWPLYKRILDTLVSSLPPDAAVRREAVDVVRRETFRQMDALGHWDVDFSNRMGRFVVASPSLARLPVSGLPRFVLLGSRAPVTLDILKQGVRNSRGRVALDSSRVDEPSCLTPLRIELVGDDVADLERIASSTGIQFSQRPFAWQIADEAPSIQQTLAGLIWEARAEPTWPRRDFEVHRLAFLSSMVEANFRLSSYANPRTTLALHLIWNGGLAAEIDRDWGRYLALARAGISVLWFDRVHSVLAVPNSVPLPRLYARVLTLCSGRPCKLTVLPQTSAPGREGHVLKLYPGVPADVARAVASKLDQELMEASLVPYAERSRDHARPAR
jgi:hypothetical protein